MLDDRRARVLQALVEEYIRTGQPVSSRIVLEESGLEVSSATVRNDLAKLESYGFVAQPHTSAGRVPTDQGYRYFVDHCAPGTLRSATRARIEAFFAEVNVGLAKLLRETTTLLSDLSHYPAVVIGPGIAGEVIRGLHLVPLTRRVLLVVTVTGAGRVTQEVVRLPFDPTDDELREAEDTLASLFVGNPLGVSDLDVDAVSPHASEHVRSLLGRVGAALRGAQETASDLFVGGTSQLATLWGDLAHVDQMLGLLEREAAVRSILEAESDGTAVRIGAEVDVDDVEIAVVSTAYEAGQRGHGRVGVIGPMRMDYRRTIKLVEEVGEGLGDSLGR
ncbi:MAG: heat-inducible transcriptional repressor HrcA [Acidimicrobiia bacterium]